MYDVIVVGGGPIGSRVAINLAVDGLSVLVLEKRSDFEKNVCCTGLVSAECIGDFHIPSLLTREEFSGAEVISPNGNSLSMCRTNPQAYSVKRNDFDAWCANEVTLVGADYLFNHHVEHIKKHPDHVDVFCMGDNDVYQGRVVVIATGFGGNLLEQCGMKKSKSFTYGIQGVGHNINFDHIKMFANRKFSSNSFAWAVPVDVENDIALCGLMTKHEPKTYFERFSQYLIQEGIVESIDDVQTRCITTSPTWHITADRALAVGDVAGQVKPITGGGIYYGLLCADLLTECLLNAFQNQTFTKQAFEPYKQEVKALLKNELKVAGYASKCFGLFTNGQIEWAFNFAKKKDLLSKLSNDSSLMFDWHGKAIINAIKKFLWH